MSQSIMMQLNNIKTLLAQKGLKLTRHRYSVLKLLLEYKSGISAYNLLDALQKIEPNAKPPTVYRALDFLIKQKIVHKIESNNHYIVCITPHATAHLSILLICHACGKVTETCLKQIENNLENIMQQHHFSGELKTLEIQGLCHACQLNKSQP